LDILGDAWPESCRKPQTDSLSRRLYFVWHCGNGYSLLATDVDDAQNRAEAAFARVPIDENSFTMKRNDEAG
jgi:hypothetical protein